MPVLGGMDMLVRLRRAAKEAVQAAGTETPFGGGGGVTEGAADAGTGSPEGTSKTTADKVKDAIIHELEKLPCT